MVCERCGNILTGKQVRWCSAKCSKLGLKNGWRKRHAERLKQYNNKWRKPKNGGNRPLAYPAVRRASKCLNCQRTDNLQVAHVKPIGLGGTHKHIITLCIKCHHEFDERLRGFWVV